MSPQNTIKIRLNKMAVNTMYIIIKELYDAHYSFIFVCAYFDMNEASSFDML